MGLDLVVVPGSRISRLPKVAQPAALLLRNLLDFTRAKSDQVLMEKVYGFKYHSYGMATEHYSPFLDDPSFNEAYRELATWWWDGRFKDVRWTMWFLTQCAAQCRMLPGAFVEFGVYRAGCAFMILSLIELGPDQTFYLFDTFQGVPATNLTDVERRAGFGGRFADTSVERVQDILASWRANTELVKGDIFDTLPTIETGAIAFCHLDLNASAPTKLALEYIYPRLLPSAMIVMDDYGHLEYEDQRRVIHEFFRDKPERPFAIPTGQGLVVKQ